jgi:hypothetical protein
MPRRERSMGSNATALQKSSESISGHTPESMPERSTVGECVKTAATVSPTENEIAAVAFQLWLANGCPVGADQEDWFRAEAMLRNARVAKCEDLSGRPSVPQSDTHAKFEMLAEFRWRGHWEVWEMEWGGARWVWD